MQQMITIEIEIPNRMVGLGEFHTVAQSHPEATSQAHSLCHTSVIGRGGEMITRLQADSGARIQVAPGAANVCLFRFASTHCSK